MRKAWDGRIIGKRYRILSQYTQMGMYFTGGAAFFAVLPYVTYNRNMDYSPVGSLTLITLGVIITAMYHRFKDVSYVITDQSVDDFGFVLLKVEYEDGEVKWEKPRKRLRDRLNFIPAD